MGKTGRPFRGGGTGHTPDNDEKAKEDFRSRLERYQQKKPYRATNP